MKGFEDLADLPEDERIRRIVEKTLRENNKVGFVVESVEKADRYIKQILDRFPGIQVLYRGPGPIAGTILVSLKRPETIQ